MVDSNGCIRSRPKSEAHLSAQGYIECKVCDDAGMLSAAVRCRSPSKAFRNILVPLGRFNFSPNR